MGKTGKLPRGLFIALEGADGVGKSTVLRTLVPQLVEEGGFGGFVFFHWKPVKGGMHRDEIPGDNPHDPRGKGARGRLASVAFLFYHWLGFQAGYWLRVRPALREGLLVVADRYSYDVLFDPKRFRLDVPEALLRAFVATIPRPGREVLLHASPAVVRKRKPELAESEIAAYQDAMLSCKAYAAALPASAEAAPPEIVREILAGIFGGGRGPDSPRATAGTRRRP